MHVYFKGNSCLQNIVHICKIKSYEPVPGKSLLYDTTPPQPSLGVGGRTIGFKSQVLAWHEHDWLRPILHPRHGQSIHSKPINYNLLIPHYEEGTPTTQKYPDCFLSWLNNSELCSTLTLGQQNHYTSSIAYRTLHLTAPRPMKRNPNYKKLIVSKCSSWKISACLINMIYSTCIILAISGCIDMFECTNYISVWVIALAK